MVTVGFVPKEKFWLAADSLEQLLRNTKIPLEVIVVDCRIPARYRAQMDRVLRGRAGVRVIEVDRFLQPNQCKNLVLRNAAHDLIALVENDSFLPPGWLESLREAFHEQGGACMVIPELFEGPVADKHLHAEEKLGRIRKWTENGVVYREILPDPSVSERHDDRSRRIIQGSEIHIVFSHRRIFERIGLLDDNLTTREHFDLSLQLHEAGIPIVLDGSVQAVFIQPPPIHLDELPYWYYVWNPIAAARTNAYLVRKWNLVNFPSSVGFARRQMWRVHPLPWRLMHAAMARVPAIAGYFSSRLLNPTETQPPP